MKVRRCRIIGAGTGTRYPCIVGALRALAQKGFVPIEAVGTSGSSIILSKLAAGASIEQLEDLVNIILPKALLDLNFFPFGGTTGLYAGNKMLSTFRKHLPPTFDELRFPMHVVAHNWTKRGVRIWSEGDLPLAVRTSMSLPIFDMVKIQGELFEDGGIDANAYFDFANWRMLVDEDVLTIGLKVRSVGHKEPRKDPFTKFDRFLATAEDMIEACDREHIRSAIMDKVAVIFIDSLYPGIKLDINVGDVRVMMSEGEAAVEAAFAAGALS